MINTNEVKFEFDVSDIVPADQNHVLKFSMGAYTGVEAGASKQDAFNNLIQSIAVLLAHQAGLKAPIINLPAAG